MTSDINLANMTKNTATEVSLNSTFNSKNVYTTLHAQAKLKLLSIMEIAYRTHYSKAQNLLFLVLKNLSKK